MFFNIFFLLRYRRRFEVLKSGWGNSAEAPTLPTGEGPTPINEKYLTWHSLDSLLPFCGLERNLLGCKRNQFCLLIVGPDLFFLWTGPLQDFGQLFLFSPKLISQKHDLKNLNVLLLLSQQDPSLGSGAKLLRISKFHGEKRKVCFQRA